MFANVRFFPFTVDSVFLSHAVNFSKNYLKIDPIRRGLPVAHLRSPFFDPIFILACNCNTDGSLSEECVQYGDVTAGQCNCKSNVMGSRCDTCKNGHYNLSKDNPSGCQSTSSDFC